MASEAERLADEGTPDEDFASIAQLQEDALAEEPLGCLAGEIEVLVEGAEIALSDDVAKAVELGGEVCGFGTGEEGLGGEAAEADVRGDKIGEDLCAVGEVLSVGEVVGCLKGELGAVEVVVGKVIGAEVVEVLRDAPVSYWFEKRRWQARTLRDEAERMRRCH